MRSTISRGGAAMGWMFDTVMRGSVPWSASGARCCSGKSKLIAAWRRRRDVQARSAGVILAFRM
jgi:hypothetical protein